MTREQIHMGDMSHETAIGILKLMLEAMETYDGISPTPERINAVKTAIESLTMSSVTPQEPKTGYWIDDTKYGGTECSECGKWYPHATITKSNIKYCSECGARMVEPQKSEEWVNFADDLIPIIDEVESEST